ncbi:MAG TPA: TaqI-like C-terminal specificity domain-containing protein, partial [Ignavibacteria bacterium]
CLSARPLVRLSAELETLPNIDINIKCGNSLIARYALDADIKQALKKSKWNIFSYRLAVMSYRNAENKEQKRTMEELIAKIKNDFHTEFSMNNPLIRKRDKLLYELYHRFTGNFLFEAGTDYGNNQAKDKGKEEQTKLENEICTMTNKIEEYENNRIFENAFEWRFEFPEVLNDEGDFVGFDIVIGNPPYISLSKIKEQAAWFENAGYETYTKVSDIYCIFYEKGVQLLAGNGILTFITSNSWMRTQYGESLRKFFVQKTNPLLLINIEDTQVFEEATVESNILIIQKGSWKKQMLACSLNADFSLSTSLENYFQNHVVLVNDLKESGWIIGNEQGRQLKAKIEMGSITVKDLNYPIYYGLKTGFNEAFFITDEQKQLLVKSDPQCSGLIRSVIRGKDIFKYGYKWKGIWVIIVKTGWTNANKNLEDAEAFFSQSYPSIYKHLRSVGETVKGKGKGLFERDDKGDYWWELRPCSYYNEFEKEKIIWGELSDDQKFTLDNEGHSSNNTIFFITGKNLRYLLAILNSKVAKWYFNEISTSSGMGTNRWLKYKIEQLPIKDIAEDKQEPFVQFVNQILFAKKSDPNTDTSVLENEIDQLVYELYGLTEEEIKIIEGVII